MLQNFNGTIGSIGETITTSIASIFEHSLDDSIDIVRIGHKTNAYIGKITNNQSIAASNIKISFMKNEIADSPFNVVYDYTYTDSNGEYAVFLETGIYKVRIDAGFQYLYFNVDITDGITEYYEYATAASIKQKIDDTIVLYGTDKVQIVGRLLNEYDLPATGQIIISQGNELISFINSSDGNYQFLLDYGTYDIRVRSELQSVIKYDNFEFTPGKGFFTEILKQKIVGYTVEQIDNLIVNEQIPSNLISEDWTHTVR